MYILIPKNVRTSVIYQIEVGICSFLASKYCLGVIYPVHTISHINTTVALVKHAKQLRTALEYCGMPFIKKRLIKMSEEKGDTDTIGLNIQCYL